MANFPFDLPPVNPCRFPDEDPELVWRNVPPPDPEPAWAESPDPLLSSSEEYWGSFLRGWWAVLISDTAEDGVVADGFAYFNKLNAGPPAGLPDDEDDDREAA
jgi:hypothetical protein